MIPAVQFEVLVAMLDALEMGEQFRTTNAVSLGKALIDASKDEKSKLKQKWEALGKLAHPTIAIPLTDTEEAEPDGNG